MIKNAAYFSSIKKSGWGSLLHFLLACVFCQYFRVTKLISRLGWLHVTPKKMASEKESFITL
jgi:hypothetical protein